MLLTFAGSMVLGTDLQVTHAGMACADMCRHGAVDQHVRQAAASQNLRHVVLIHLMHLYDVGLQPHWPHEKAQSVHTDTATL